MADTRINALSTATSSVSDDFVPIDGTTNGTRKLSAFSPSFGGNATVGGTLTAGSGSHVFGNSANTAVIKAQRLTTDPSSVELKAVASHAIIDFTGDTGYTWGRIGSAGNEILRIYHAGLTSITAVAGGGLAVGGGLNVSATTASTTTSTGALVVGNGTSGGLGVGGNINAGGYLRSINSSAANGSEFTALRADVGADGTLGAALVTIGVLPSATAASRYGFITCYDNGDWRTLYLGGSPGVAANGGQVRVPATITSTSTSSGALVVSGGVGVAGAINAGGTITSTNGSGSGLLGMRSSSGNASYVFWSETGVADRGILGFNNGSSTLSYRSFSSSFSTGTEVFSVTSAGNITTGGNITTAAPAGGTAAAWKLGTVATVSPTSPNRTIEVDIGGTIYYIHAKTTNN